MTDWVISSILILHGGIHSYVANIVNSVPVLVRYHCCFTGLQIRWCWELCNIFRIVWFILLLLIVFRCIVCSTSLCLRYSNFVFCIWTQQTAQLGTSSATFCLYCPGTSSSWGLAMQAMLWKWRFVCIWLCTHYEFWSLGLHRSFLAVDV